MGITATDITEIEGNTSGAVTVSNNINLKGTAAEIAAAVDDVNTFSNTPTAQLSNAHTLAELKAINNKIDGTITLGDYTVALSGTVADVKDALSGTFAAAYTGNVEITDGVSDTIT